MPRLKIAQLDPDDLFPADGIVDLAIAQEFVDALKKIANEGYWDACDGVYAKFLDDHPILNILEGVFTTEGSPGLDIFKEQIDSIWNTILQDRAYTGLNDVLEVKFVVVREDPVFETHHTTVRNAKELKEYLNSLDDELLETLKIWTSTDPNVSRETVNVSYSTSDEWNELQILVHPDST